MDCADKRYMLDTSALNRIMLSTGDEISVYRSKSFGYTYYFSEIQVDEVINNVQHSNPDIPSNLVERDRVVFSLKMMKLIIKLESNYVGQIFTFRPYRCLLDGTFSILSEGKEIAADIFKDILNENDKQHYNDAMIAMTAIDNDCVLVTDDKRLFNKINKYLPNRAIKYDDFIKKVNLSN